MIVSFRKTVKHALQSSLVCIAIGLSPAQLLAKDFAQLDADGYKAKITLKNADITQFIQTVARQLDITFVVHPSVKARLNFEMQEPVGPSEFYDTFLSVLSDHGYVVIPGNDFKRVVPDEKYNAFINDHSMIRTKITDNPFFENGKLVGYKID